MLKFQCFVQGLVTRLFGPHSCRDVATDMHGSNDLTHIVNQTTITGLRKLPGEVRVAELPDNRESFARHGSPPEVTDKSLLFGQVRQCLQKAHTRYHLFPEYGHEALLKGSVENEKAELCIERNDRLADVVHDAT